MRRGEVGVCARAQDSGTLQLTRRGPGSVGPLGLGMVLISRSVRASKPVKPKKPNRLQERRKFLGRRAVGASAWRPGCSLVLGMANLQPGDIKGSSSEKWVQPGKCMKGSARLLWAWRFEGSGLVCCDSWAFLCLDLEEFCGEGSRVWLKKHTPRRGRRSCDAAESGGQSQPGQESRDNTRKPLPPPSSTLALGQVALWLRLHYSEGNLVFRIPGRVECLRYPRARG